MTITLDLPRELEEELSAEASREGLSIREYVLRLLAMPRAAGPKPKSGAQLVDYWQTEKRVGLRPEIRDSQAFARELRDEAERRGPD